MQYDLLSADPFRWTENEVLFESWWRRQDGAASASEAEKECVRAEWLRGSRPCLRASPLVSSMPAMTDRGHLWHRMLPSCTTRSPPVA